ncbi:MAG TPA: ankyrin repeat domain-containing protein [Rhabdochlamydiaceae bacterium]|nr:ankyrin repeat domain-containing protein [Rhabdochlamydiaceae bacterium]
MSIHLDIATPPLSHLTPAPDEAILFDDKFLDSPVATHEKCLTLLGSLKVFNEEKLNKLFHRVVKKGDAYIEVVRFLIQNCNVAVDVKDETGKTALMSLCTSKNPQKALISLLVEKGADIYAKDAMDRTLLQRLCRDNQIELVTLLLNQPQEYAKKVIEELAVKFLVGHTNSIEQTVGMNFEVARGGAGAALFSKILESLPNEISKLIADQHKQKLIQAFTNTKDFPTIKKEEIVEKIRRGDLVFLPVGYDTHAIYLVFCNGYMEICNRGEGLADHAKMLEAYQIDSKAFTLDTLKKIIEIEKGKCTAATQYYYRTLPQELSRGQKKPMKNATCLQLEKLSPKEEQKIGNCSYASAKLALRAGTALLCLRKKRRRFILSDGNAAAARQFSKVVSTHVRLTHLEKYYTFHEKNKVPNLFDGEFSNKALAIVNKHLAKHAVISIENYPHVSKKMKLK